MGRVARRVLAPPSQGKFVGGVSMKVVDLLTNWCVWTTLAFLLPAQAREIAIGSIELSAGETRVVVVDSSTRRITVESVRGFGTLEFSASDVVTLSTIRILGLRNDGHGKTAIRLNRVCVERLTVKGSPIGDRPAVIIQQSDCSVKIVDVSQVGRLDANLVIGSIGSGAEDASLSVFEGTLGVVRLRGTVTAPPVRIILQNVALPSPPRSEMPLLGIEDCQISSVRCDVVSRDPTAELIVSVTRSLLQNSSEPNFSIKLPEGAVCLRLDQVDMRGRAKIVAPRISSLNFRDVRSGIALDGGPEMVLDCERIDMIRMVRTRFSRFWLVAKNPPSMRRRFMEVRDFEVEEQLGVPRWLVEFVASDAAAVPTLFAVLTLLQGRGYYSEDPGTTRVGLDATYYRKRAESYERNRALGAALDWATGFGIRLWGPALVLLGGIVAHLVLRAAILLRAGIPLGVPTVVLGLWSEPYWIEARAVRYQLEVVRRVIGTVLWLQVTLWGLYLGGAVLQW